MAIINCRIITNSETRDYCLKAEREGRLATISQTPITQLDFSGDKPERIPIGDSGDLFTLQLEQDRHEKAYETELARGKFYLAALGNKSHPPLIRSALPNYFQTLPRLPWGIFPAFFEDGKQATDDDRLLKWSLDRIHGFQTELEKKGMKAGTAEYDLEMLRKLLRFCSSRNGWGLKFSKTDHLPRTPLGSFHHKKVDCFNFENPFLTLSKLAGLNAFPIELFRNTEGKWITHLEVAVRLGPPTSTEVVSVDFQNGKIVPRSGKKEKDWSEITLLELLSLAYVNWAADSVSHYSAKQQTIPRGILRKQTEKLEQALLYSRHYLVLANYAACLFNLGDEQSLRRGEAVFAEAFKANPLYFQESEIGKSIYANYQMVREGKILLSTNLAQR